MSYLVSLARLASLTCSLLLVGCTSISHIGSIGTLKVYNIKATDFFAANRLLIVVDAEGRAVMGAGGTVSGPGPIAAGLMGSAMLGAGVAYSGHALQQGLENVKVSGHLNHSLGVADVPKDITIHWLLAIP
jgi:hypothetical protein